MKNHHKVLILGASYGSLLGVKLGMAGHDVDLVCLPDELRLINEHGARVLLPVRKIDQLIELDSRTGPGALSAISPENVSIGNYDLVALAMQEPQYSAPSVKKLLDTIGTAEIPCMSIMNMPPISYLKRITGLDTEACKTSYTDASVWDKIIPSQITLCSPDPQAFRPPDKPANVLQVGLPTNFKVAAFESKAHTRILKDLETDIQNLRYDSSKGKVELPVKLKVHESIFVPLAKWNMLLAGNYRCIQKDGMRSIKDAVHSDIEESKSVYNWVVKLCLSLGASLNDLVPFEKYATAALSLGNPSSAARALANGATNIERVDRLVQTIAIKNGMHSDAIDRTVDLVDEWLITNRKSL